MFLFPFCYTSSMDSQHQEQELGLEQELEHLEQGLDAPGTNPSSANPFPAADALARLPQPVLQAVAWSLAGLSQGAVRRNLQLHCKLSIEQAARIARMPLLAHARTLAPVLGPSLARKLAQSAAPMVTLRQIAIASEGSERNATPAAHLVLRLAGLEADDKPGITFQQAILNFWQKASPRALEEEGK